MFKAIGDFLKWYLEKFGTHEFMVTWLGWMGFVTLCINELHNTFTGKPPSELFDTMLGGVVGYIVGKRAFENGKTEKDHPPSEEKK